MTRMPIRSVVLFIGVMLVGVLHGRAEGAAGVASGYGVCHRRRGLRAARSQ